MGKKPESKEKTEMSLAVNQWDQVMEPWNEQGEEDSDEEVQDEEDDFDKEGQDEEAEDAALVAARRHCLKHKQGPGIEHPFDPLNACCNAPCPPGAFCNTCECDLPTEFYVQKWTCVWQQSPLSCCKGKGKSDEECAWTKAWRCNWHHIGREDVLKVFRCAQPQRCPVTCGGESECFVPQDTYFAKVLEIGYEECDKKKKWKNPCLPYRFDAMGQKGLGGKFLKVGGCACCGLFQTCKERWVRIRSKADIPPLHPYAPPLPYYERPECQPKRRNYCQCVTCAPAVAKSPNLRGLGTPVV